MKSQFIFLFSLPILGLILGSPGTALSQQAICDESLTPQQNEGGYKSRQNGTRCEGLYIGIVGGKGLSLISLTLGKLTFDLKKDTEAEISFPHIDNAKNETVFVRAVSVPLRTYYRMDTRINPPAQSVVWPLDVLKSLKNMSTTKVGIFGRIEREGSDEYLPLRIGPPGQAKPGGPIKLVVRTSIETELVQWRSFPLGKNRTKKPTWIKVSETVKPSGTPIEIIVPNGPTTIFRLQISAKTKDMDDWDSLTLKIIRPGIS